MRWFGHMCNRGPGSAPINRDGRIIADGALKTRGWPQKTRMEAMKKRFGRKGFM